jgi:hypothetical protein
VEFPPDLTSLAFALAHLLDAVGDPHRPLDAAQHDRQLARRERPIAERDEHGIQRDLRIVRASDRRQLEPRRPVGPARPRPLRDNPHGDRITAAGEKNDALCRLRGFSGELFLPGDGLLVARPGRPPGRIAALSWLESHG